MGKTDLTELEAARAAALHYLDPRELGDAAGRRERLLPTTPVPQSYVTQVYVRLRDRRRITVRPVAGDVEPKNVQHPRTRWLLTAWNPDGRPQTLRQQEHADDLLRRRVHEAGGRVVATGTTVPPTREWLEEHLVVTGLSPGAAVRVGLESGQPAVTAMTTDALVVLPTGLRDDVEEHHLAFVVELTTATCPMRTDDVLEARCLMRGGPFGSAAIHAAAIWEAHRRLLTRALGCDACGDGVLPTLGRYTSPEIAFGDLVLPSRYGGWAWS